MIGIKFVRLISNMIKIGSVDPEIWPKKWSKCGVWGIFWENFTNYDSYRKMQITKFCYRQYCLWDGSASSSFWGAIYKYRNLLTFPGWKKKVKWDRSETFIFNMDVRMLISNFWDCVQSQIHRKIHRSSSETVENSHLRYISKLLETVRACSFEIFFRLVETERASSLNFFLIFERPSRMLVLAKILGSTRRDRRGCSF